MVSSQPTTAEDRDRDHQSSMVSGASTNNNNGYFKGRTEATLESIQHQLDEQGVIIKEIADTYNKDHSSYITKMTLIEEKMNVLNNKTDSLATGLATINSNWEKAKEGFLFNKGKVVGVLGLLAIAGTLILDVVKPLVIKAITGG